jgi:ribosomal protein S18 acetylase RimI-like enzyme
VSAFEVRQLTVADAPHVRAIRLEALTLHPDSFSSDAEHDLALTPEQWRERLAPGRWYGAFISRDLVGVVAWLPGQTRKSAHAGELAGMYVRESARGSGVADALIEAVLAAAATELDHISLAVNAENTRAVRVYERHGFRTVGRMPDALRVSGRSYDELLMWRNLTRG